VLALGDAAIFQHGRSRASRQPARAAPMRSTASTALVAETAIRMIYLEACRRHLGSGDHP